MSGDTAWNYLFRILHVILNHSETKLSAVQKCFGWKSQMPLQRRSIGQTKDTQCLSVGLGYQSFMGAATLRKLNRMYSREGIIGRRSLVMERRVHRPNARTRSRSSFIEVRLCHGPPEAPSDSEIKDQRTEKNVGVKFRKLRL